MNAAVQPVSLQELVQTGVAMLVVGALLWLLVLWADKQRERLEQEQDELPGGWEFHDTGW